MAMTYRARRRWRNLGIALLALLLAAVAAWICWAVWLGRYMTYSRDGARLDFSLSPEDLVGEQVERPEPQETIHIIYNEGEELITSDVELTRLVGYYITLEDLQGDLGSLRTTLQGLEKGTAVMLDLKNGRGGFYYSSKIPTAMSSGDVDAAKIDQLISWLRLSQLYVIARVPSFQDWNYALINHENRNYISLPLSSGALWMDDEGCYWLDPEEGDTMAYLAQIAGELQSLGFDEVVFSGFRYPDTTKIVYREGLNKTAALEKLAQDLVTTSATETFAVSFQTGNTSFTAPQGRSRLYLTDVPADQVQSVVENAAVVDKATGLVFRAQPNDTRYTDYGVLRPVGNLG